LIYVGIDPGEKGGIAGVADNWLIVEPMPDTHLLADVFDDWHKKHKIAHVFLEKGQAMPWHSRSSTFKYGHHCGFIEAVLYTLRISYTLIGPQQWQKEMFKGTNARQGKKKRNPKDRALESCSRLFPREKFLATARSTKPHDGMIDALLMAECCRRRMK